MVADIARPQNIGVINPFALVELKLHQQLDWRRIAEPARLIEQTLNVEYSKLFDPQFASPLYPHLRFDPAKRELVRDPKVPSLKELHASLFGPVRKAPGLGPMQQWARPADSHFFTDPADFTDPVQGAIPDCHFISALASLAWAKPYNIMQRTRPIAASDSFEKGSGIDMVSFFSAPGAAVEDVEVTEFLPLMEPGDGYIYARCGDPKETWPQVYEKAWVKWVTKDTGDHPDYTKIGGGDPIFDLMTLTGLNQHYESTQGVTPDQIWNTVRSHSAGSWTFDPMCAWTYASAAEAPTPINYASANLVAWHVYSILGWQYDSVAKQQYVVLRNPWGNTEATLNVDNAPWFSIEQVPFFLHEKFGEGSLVRSLTLPGHGIFALRADTFQQYFKGYGWVA